jgi:hypothetical protein
MKNFIEILFGLLIISAIVIGLSYPQKVSAQTQKTNEPTYIVKLEIKQSTFTLDIFEHIKNQVNAIEMEIPVDKRFYDSVRIGQEINRGFKYGSLIFNGDFSTLKVKVIGKRIQR